VNWTPVVAKGISKVFLYKAKIKESKKVLYGIDNFASIDYTEASIKNAVDVIKKKSDERWFPEIVIKEEVKVEKVGYFIYYQSKGWMLTHKSIYSPKTKEEALFIIDYILNNSNKGIISKKNMCTLIKGVCGVNFDIKASAFVHDVAQMLDVIKFLNIKVL